MKTGHRPDPIDGRDRLYRDRTGAGAPLDTSDEPSVLRFCPPVWDQIAEDCSAHAAAGLLMTVAASKGAPIAEPSKLFLYDVAILEEKPRQPLVDAGSGLRWMLKGLKGRGVCSEARWPELPQNINVVPPDDCWDSAEESQIIAYEKLSDGAASADEGEHALRQLRPFTVCMIVDARFRDTIKGVYDGQGGAVIGPHAMLCVAYSRTLDAFRLRNSWGIGYHDGGYVWISRRVMNLYTYSKWLIDFDSLLIV